MTDAVDPKDIKSVIGLLVDPTKSDREVAIVALAYIEDHLGRAIRSKMPGLTSDVRDKLFSPSGALSPMGARIDLAKALGLIDSKDRSDFIILARVRNRFAHNVNIESFDHPEISELTQKLHLVNDLMSGQGKFQGGGVPPAKFVENFGGPPRNRFLLAALT
ncbi:MAG TPA: hypothetical protein VGN98_01240, partial [Tianweitania sediminis]|nr:hypothetical protein [Tianweitania sediminis]